MGKSKYVVTITRQFGSMGRPIAKKMAEKLGIEYYVVRGKFDLRLCTDSAQFDKDLNFSTLFLRVALTMATWE